MPNYDINTTYSAQTSTDNFEDLRDVIDTYKTPDALSMIIDNTGSNALKWKVLASNDENTWIEVKAEATVNSSSADSFTKENPEYRYYKIQFAANSAGNQSDAVLSVTAK